MIIYTQQCLSCANRKLWVKIKTFATVHGLSIEVRRTIYSKNRDEADQYGIALPFVVEDGVALSLSEPLEGLLR